MTTEQLLDKWQALDPDEGEQVLAFIDSIYRQKLPTKSASIFVKIGSQIRQ